MTSRPTPRGRARLLALTTLAITGLLLAPAPQAEARGKGARTAIGAGLTSTANKATPHPIVRDHRWGSCGFHRSRPCNNRKPPAPRV
jgi:hypothetical protein